MNTETKNTLKRLRLKTLKGYPGYAASILGRVYNYKTNRFLAVKDMDNCRGRYNLTKNGQRITLSVPKIIRLSWGCDA